MNGTLLLCKVDYSTEMVITVVIIPMTNGDLSLVLLSIDTGMYTGMF